MSKLANWWSAAKRRRPGIYLYITRRHLKPWRWEFGYGGKSLHLPSRDKDHAGTGRWTHKDKPCPNAPKPCTHGEKPWYDLVIRRRTLELPWWIGWDWVISILEALMIWTLRPRYNDQLNPRRSKVRKYEQQRQRAERDRPDYAERVAAARAGRWLSLQVFGVLLIVSGLTGWLMTR